MITEAMKTYGAFSWNELMTNDVPGAKAFYGKLLGWSLEDMETSCGPYTFAKTGETEAAGIMAITDECPDITPMWGSYITVEDVDSMPARVEKLGGTVLMPPQDIPDVGRFMVVKDPQGAMFTMITYFMKD